MNTSPMNTPIFPIEYAPLNPTDAEAILGAGGEYVFTCNYNKLTNDTHPKFITKIVNKGMKAAQDGEDYCPVFVSQIRHLTLMVDLHADESILNDIIVPFVDEQYSNKLTVVYKIPFELSKNRKVELPVGPVAPIESTPYLYIIHPATSLSELYLPNSSVGGSSNVFTRILSNSGYAWMGLPKNAVGARMRGMAPPFCGTEMQRLVNNILGPLLASYGGHPMDAFQELSSIADIRQGERSVLPEAKELIRDMYSKTLCTGCPNALLCMASGNEEVHTSGEGHTVSHNMEVHEKHLVQQTCIENYFRVFMARIGLDGAMTPRALLMMQRKITQSNTSTEEGYYTQHLVNVVTGIYQNVEKPVDWLTRKVKADGFSWAPAKVSYNGKLRNPIGGLRNPGYMAYGIRNLKEAALSVNLFSSVRLTHLDYFPDRYDKRECKTELTPAVGKIDGATSTEDVVLSIVRVLLSSNESYSSIISVGHSCAGAGTEYRDKIMQVLSPLMKEDEGKTYLEVDTAFTDETAFQGVHMAMLSIKGLIKKNQRLHPMALKELQFVQVNTALKLSHVLCAAYAGLQEKRYGHTGMCQHASDCRHSTEYGGCALSGISGNEWSAYYGKGAKVRQPLMPCVTPINNNVNLITDGPDIIYLKLTANLPQLEDSLVALAIHLDRIRVRDIKVGGSAQYGVSSVVSPKISDDKTEVTRGAAMRVIALYVAETMVYPIVMAPTEEFLDGYDAYYAMPEAVSTLLPYVPSEGTEAIRSEYETLVKAMRVPLDGATDKGYGQLDGAKLQHKNQSVLWMPDSSVVTNTEGHLALRTSKPVFNLRSVEKYRSTVEDLTPQQLLCYEQLRIRVIPILAPMVYPTMAINGGAYENGCLQFLSKAQAPGEPAHQLLSVTKGLPQATLFQVITNDVMGQMSPHLARGISTAFNRRQSLMPLESKMILAKDSRIKAYKEVIDSEGNLVDIEVVRHTYKGADMATKSQAGYIGSTARETSILEVGWKDATPSHTALVQAVTSSTSEDMQREVRRQLYRADYALLLSHYWTVNGKATSPMGVSALLLGNNPINEGEFANKEWV